MRVAGLLPTSFVNGEGIRFVIFTQGCAHRCKGCQNPDTWNFFDGFDISVEDLAERIKGYPLIDGITLSGGDPFYQEEECVKLLKLLPRMNVWVYTGFEYEEIKDTELAKMADALVVGPYIQDLRCEGKMFGSSNQKIIFKGDMNHG